MSTTTNLTPEQVAALAKLREPFPLDQIELLPKPFKKDSPKAKCSECGGYHGMPAVHLHYVGHAGITMRLLEVDPLWNWEPLATDDSGMPIFDRAGGLWIRLTVAGMTRLGYGDGDSVKEIIGDAIRNATMRFGGATYLWSKSDAAKAELLRGGQNLDTDPDEPTAPEAPPEPPAPKTITKRAAARLAQLQKQAAVDDAALADLLHIWDVESLEQLDTDRAKRLADRFKARIAAASAATDQESAE